MGTKILVSTNAGVAAGAGSAVTALAYKAPSGVAARVLRYGVSFDGTSSTDARATVDFRKNPNSAGTPGSDISSEIAIVSGLGTTVGNAYQAYSAEPGSGASTRDIRGHQMAPTGPYEAALGVDLAPGETICLRTKGASGKLVRAWFEIELG